MHKWAFVILSLASGAATVDAKDTSLSFSSAYTYLSKDCEWAYSKSELIEGQDNALVCKGLGGYEIFIFFSAMDSHLDVRLKDSTSKDVFGSAIGGVDWENGVVEWRIANGAPFAIIVRSKEYSTNLEGDRKLSKNSLVVRGFGQHSEISGVVNAKKNKLANEKARKLADDKYRIRRNPPNR